MVLVWFESQKAVNQEESTKNKRTKSSKEKLMKSNKAINQLAANTVFITKQTKKILNEAKVVKEKRKKAPKSNETQKKRQNTRV